VKNISSVREDAWVHIIVQLRHFLLKFAVSSQERELSCMCVS